MDPEGGWRTGEGALIAATLLYLSSLTVWGPGSLRAEVLCLLSYIIVTWGDKATLQKLRLCPLEPWE